MSLASLTIDIAANLARLESDLGRASNQLERWTKQAQKLIGSLAIGIGVNEFREFIAGSIDAADAASKASQKIGISTESYSALSYAAKLADIENEEFTASMVKLDKAISEAGEGSKKQAAAFADLGVSVKNADGSLKSADEVLLSIADKFANTKDGAAKTAIALDIFGKSGAQMIPLLNGGAAAIEQLRAEAERLGIVISADLGRAAEEFNDSITTMKARASGLGMAMANDLLPALNNITAAINDMNKAGDAGVGAGLATALKAVVSTGAGVVFVFDAIGDALGAAAAAAVAAAHGELKEAARIRAEMVENRQVMIAQSANFIDRVWTDPARESVKSANTQKTSIDRVASAQLEAAEKAKKADEQRGEKIAHLVQELERQAATVGETTSQTKLYELAQMGATDADIKRASSAQLVITAYEKQQEVYQAQVDALERAGQLREESLSPELRAVGALKDKYAELDDAVQKHVISKNEADKTKEGLSTNFLNDIVDPTKTELEKLKDSYDKKQQMLDEAHAAGVASEDDYLSALGKLNDKYDKDKRKLQAAALSQQLQNAGELADGLTGLAQITAGKQSGIYKAMFAASKAFAIADAIVKIQAGIASAAEAPWPANIAAIGSVIAATGSIVSTIKSTNMGQAHAGLENVPQDATYMLKSGERVLAPSQNKDLTNFLANGGGSGFNVTVIENGRGGEVKQNGDQIEIYIAKFREAMASDIIRGGNNISRAMEGTYALNRGSGARR